MIIFGIFSLFIVLASLMMLRSKKLIYSALWLAGMLVSVAVLYLTLGAEFLAVVQILVYAGAVVTLILFAIMFTQREGQ